MRVLVLLGILASVWGQAADSTQTWWWKVRIEVSVRGNYSCVGHQGEATGQYSFVVANTSAMERENGDYVLFPGDSQIMSLDWLETEAGDNGSRVTNVERLVKPILRLNYVLREKGRVSFDFEIKSAWLEMWSGEACRHLILPRSYENLTIHPNDRYNRDVREGNNRVDLKNKLLDKRDQISETIRWRWERTGAAGRHEHSVECRISLLRQLKQ